MGFLILLPFLLAAAVSADRLAVSSMRGASQGHRLLGADSCTWGPSYWCGHVKNARECSAMEHCTKAVWLKHAEPQDASAECRWCDDMLDDLKDLIKVNTSKTALRGYLKDGCRRHPVAESRIACLDNISSYIPEVRQMLKVGVPDRTVCKTLGFCSEEAKKQLPRVNEKVTVGRNYCADCYHFFDDAKELYLGNYTEAEYKEMLLQQCEQTGYPAITDLCKMVIEQYWPQIYSRLEMFFDPEEVCYQITMCNGTTAGSSNKNPRLPWGTLTSSRTLQPLRPLQPLQPLQAQQLPTSRMLLNFDPFMPQSAAGKPRKLNAKGEWTDVECVVCEFVMSYLDRMLEDNYTEASIQSALDRVCQQMPKSVRDECQSFVDQYAPAILVILGNELDPAQVCQGLQLCTSGKTPAKKCENGNGNKNATCESCTVTFQAIKTLFESDVESNRLALLVKSACGSFPAGKVREQCETVVVQYVPYFMQIAAQLTQPDALCRAFKMCSTV